MKTGSYTEEIEFNASPELLFEMLMDEKIHSEFTGEPAKISRRKGGKFTAWGDYISGKNISIEKYSRIVQEWHASDMPEGHVSIVTFEFIPSSNTTTILKFTHDDVPATLLDSYKKGWEDFYWAPMKAWIRKNKKSSR